MDGFALVCCVTTGSRLELWFGLGRLYVSVVLNHKHYLNREKKGILFLLYLHVDFYQIFRPLIGLYLKREREKKNFYSYYVYVFTCI